MNKELPYREIATTADGSKTLFVPQWDEHYHSIHGARQESLHVFIDAGLKYYLEQYAPKLIHIFEVGLGTALNALLTAQHVKDHSVQIKYQSIEAYPLTMDEVHALNYIDANDEASYQLNTSLHQSSWGEWNAINENFSILKIHDFLENWNSEEKVDIVYFDAFAPSAQPQLWTEDIFRMIYENMSENGILVTYCAKGVVKRAMKAAGFKIEALPGPPGKREMTRAVKVS